MNKLISTTTRPELAQLIRVIPAIAIGTGYIWLLVGCRDSSSPSGLVPAPSPPSSIGWWPGEANGNDVIGTNHAVVPYGVSFAQGQVGQAFRFDRVDDRNKEGAGFNAIRILGYGRKLPASEITIEFWQKVDERWQQCSVSLSSYDPGRSCRCMAPYVDGKIYFDFGNNRNGGQLGYRPPGSIIGTWQHLAFVASESGNFMKIYRNGALEAQKVGMSPLENVKFDLLLGDGFAGLLDEVKIYDRALSTREILAIYNASSGRTGSAGSLKTQPTAVRTLSGAESISPAAHRDHINGFARAPYVQLATPDSMTVVWRTEGAIKPVLRYGVTLEHLERQIAAAAIVMRVALTTNEAELKVLKDTQPELFRLPKLHSAPAGIFQYEARITDLKPDTQYYYAVYDGDRRLTEPDSTYRFVTHPPQGETKAARFWVVGDSGTGRETQHSVHTAMLGWTQRDQRPVDFFLHLGGMALERGRDVEFQTRFFEMYEPTLRHVVCWPTMGDHEGATSKGTNAVGPYYDAYVCPTKGEAGGVPSGTEAFYSFDYGRIHYICLDSHDLDRKPTGQMARWLKRDLEQTRADWIIAFFHHPPYTKGTHDSDREKQLIEMRTHVMPILESGGVDLVLSSHSRIYERSMLMDSAYTTPTAAKGVVLDDSEGDPRTSGPYRKSVGLQPNNGTIQVVVGNGGAPLGRKGTTPVMRKCIVEHGSVVIDIDGDTLLGTMLNKFGEARDVFGLVKQSQVVHERLLNPWQPPPWTIRLPGDELPAQPPEDFLVVIPKYSEWTYLAGDHPEGTKWTELSFDANGWKRGEAPFGYEYKEVRTALDEMKGHSSVVYLRHEFEVHDVGHIAELGLMISYDDAFIAYLNGVEVLRQGVGRGAGKEAQQVKSHEAARYSYFPLKGFERHIRDGRNLLAIEGHNATSDSSDLLVDPWLLIER